MKKQAKKDEKNETIKSACNQNKPTMIRVEVIIIRLGSKSC
jgi:hypothetical protein